MLFRLIKIPAKVAIKIYCRKVSVNNKDLLSLNGPLLIACNHPNSFLDAVILATIFKKPIYSLARGDSFKNKFISNLLRKLNILPVYRISEGAENLNNNYDTFATCRDIFRKNGIVLIFSEGLCINEWKLRSLKKGTARLAFSSWEEGIELTILPAGINYHSFKSFGKNVEINFGNTIKLSDLESKSFDGRSVILFNQKLKDALMPLVHHFDSNDIESIRNKYSIQQEKKLLQKTILLLPSFIGKWIHAPLYLPIKTFCLKKAGNSDHYDAVLVGLLFILYPIFLSVIALIVYVIFGGWYWILSFLILPFFAWAFIQLKQAY